MKLKKRRIVSLVLVIQLLLSSIFGSGSAFGGLYSDIDFNSDLDFSWIKYYGGTGDDVCTTLLESPDEGFVMVGYTNSNRYRQSQNRKDNDILVVKINTNGDVIWERSYGGVGEDIAYSAVASYNGGYTIVGFTEEDGDFDLYLLSIDDEGNKKWDSTIGGRGNEYAYDIIKAGKGEYVVVGSSSSREGIFAYDENSEFQDLPEVVRERINNNLSDAWIFKVNGKGELTNSKNLTLPDEMHSYSSNLYSKNCAAATICTNDDGGYVVSVNKTEDTYTHKSLETDINVLENASSYALDIDSYLNINYEISSSWVNDSLIYENVAVPNEYSYIGVGLSYDEMIYSTFTSNLPGVYSWDLSNSVYFDIAQTIGTHFLVVGTDPSDKEILVNRYVPEEDEIYLYGAYKGDGNDVLTSVVVTNTNEYVFAGSTNSKTGYNLSTDLGGYDFMLMKSKIDEVEVTALSPNTFDMRLFEASEIVDYVLYETTMYNKHHTIIDLNTSYGVIKKGTVFFTNESRELLIDRAVLKKLYYDDFIKEYGNHMIEELNDFINAITTNNDLYYKFYYTKGFAHEGGKLAGAILSTALTGGASSGANGANLTTQLANGLNQYFAQTLNDIREVKGSDIIKYLKGITFNLMVFNSVTHCTDAKEVIDELEEYMDSDYGNPANAEEIFKKYSDARNALLATHDYFNNTVQKELPNSYGESILIVAQEEFNGFATSMLLGIIEIKVGKRTTAVTLSDEDYDALIKLGDMIVNIEKFRNGMGDLINTINLVGGNFLEMKNYYHNVKIRPKALNIELTPDYNKSTRLLTFKAYDDVDNTPIALIDQKSMSKQEYSTFVSSILGSKSEDKIYDNNSIVGDDNQLKVEIGRAHV